MLESASALAVDGARSRLPEECRQVGEVTRMGYCPRCGENTPWRKRPATMTRQRRPVRVLVGSRIVTLPPGLQDGDRVRYGGVLFEVHRYGEVIELHLVDR
jgi:hypothetical protein